MLNIVKRYVSLLGIVLLYAYIIHIDLFFCISISNIILRNAFLLILLTIFIIFTRWGIGVKDKVKEYSSGKMLLTQISILGIVFLLYYLFKFLKIYE